MLVGLGLEALSLACLPEIRAEPVAALQLLFGATVLACQLDHVLGHGKPLVHAFGRPQRDVAGAEGSQQSVGVIDAPSKLDGVGRERAGALAPGCVVELDRKPSQHPRT